MNIVRPLSLVLLAGTSILAGQQDLSPRPDERQVPKAMRSAMRDLPLVKVGRHSGDMIGADERVLQAAVDYVSSLGGGTVEIGEGEYLMRDSLHLRSFITVKGVPGKTILKKANGVVSPLAIDGDYGEEQVTVKDPEGFMVGGGITIADSKSGGFHTTVARITGRKGNTFTIDHPLNADCMVDQAAKASSIFPIVSGCNIEGARIEGLVVEGNKEHNGYLDGCRGGGIYLYRGFGTVIRHCTVRSFNGDGISFQQSNDVIVENCVSEKNTQLGLHPGSGSQRAVVRNSTARDNGTDGLFLCWRVRHGTFENNLLEGNGRFGISIGHKDTDNLIQLNQVRANKEDGIFFRNESYGMAGHRNRVEKNTIENNGDKQPVAGIRVRGETGDLLLKENIIRDTRSEPKQTVGIRLEERVLAVQIENNQLEAETPLKDQRKTATASK